MKRMYKLLPVPVLLVIFLSLCPQLCDAQGDPNGDPDAPIDGGVSLLVAAGIGYGVKKANDRRKKNKTVNISDINK